MLYAEFKGVNIKPSRTIERTVGKFYFRPYFKLS